MPRAIQSGSLDLFVTLGLSSLQAAGLGHTGLYEQEFHSESGRE